jgi:hypothetical protein
MAEHDKTPIDYDSEDHDITRAEHDRPHNSIILALVFATVGSLVVVLLAIIQFFDVSVRNEVTSKVLDVPSTPLRDLRAAENAKLSGYAWVSQQQGVVRLPLDRAIELTARDWESRPSGLVEVKEEAPPPAPAPGGGAAPATGAPAGTTAPPGASPTGAPQTPGTPSPNPETLPTGAPAPPPAGTPMAPSSPGAAPTEGATPR